VPGVHAQYNNNMIGYIVAEVSYATDNVMFVKRAPGAYMPTYPEHVPINYTITSREGECTKSCIYETFR